LAFREVTPLTDLLQILKQTNPDIFPQVIIVDGNGTLHPRRFGLASHLGVLANVPSSRTIWKDLGCCMYEKAYKIFI